MDALTIIPGRIAGLALAALLEPFGDLPVVVRIPRGGGHDDHPLDVGRTDIAKKFAQDTTHGDIDLIRIMVDGSDPAIGDPLTASRVAGRLTTHDPVKFVVYDQDVSFLVGTDATAERVETEERTVCLVTMVDRDDA